MTDLDDLIAFVTDKIGFLESLKAADPELGEHLPQYQAILACLVSLRDAGKELPDSEEMNRVLRSFGEAYPEDIFGPVTEDEQKQYGNLITRNSAAMGRHCAKFMAQAADHIDALRAHAVADRARVRELEANRWCPDVCPITGRPFFMWIEHYESGRMVPTYGGPYDSYTIPIKDGDGDFVCERFDHDEGAWMVDERENIGIQIVSDQAYVFEDDEKERAESAESRVRELEAERDHNDAEHKRLVRELDVIINGESGAAQQASLCDIVSQVRATMAKLKDPTKAMVDAGKKVMDSGDPHYVFTTMTAAMGVE